MGDHSDMKAHSATYEGVVTMIKWSTIACAILVAFVIWLIAG